MTTPRHGANVRQPRRVDDVTQAVRLLVVDGIAEETAALLVRAADRQDFNVVAFARDLIEQRTVARELGGR